MLVDGFKVYFMENPVDRSEHYNRELVQKLDFELQEINSNNPDMVGMSDDTIRGAIRQLNCQIQELEKPLIPLYERKQALHDLLNVRIELQECGAAIRKIEKIKRNPKKYRRFARRTKISYMERLYDEWSEQDANDIAERTPLYRLFNGNNNK